LVSWLYPQKVRETTVVGKKKMALFDDTAEPKLRLYDVRNTDHPDTPPLSRVSPLENQCRHFLACVKTRRDPLTSGYDGYVNIRILEAAQRSMESKREVTVGL